MVTVDGKAGQRACMVKVADGMAVASAFPAEPAPLGNAPTQIADQPCDILVVGAGILVLRPALNGLNSALLHNTILPNFGTLIRWRAHSHVLRQPVGWFESDFAGRLANRIMQTPPA